MEKTYYKNGNLKETVKKVGDQTTVTRYINNFPSKELLYKGDRLSREIYFYRPKKTPASQSRPNTWALARSKIPVRKRILVHNLETGQVKTDIFHDQTGKVTATMDDQANFSDKRTGHQIRQRLVDRTGRSSITRALPGLGRVARRFNQARHKKAMQSLAKSSVAPAPPRAPGTRSRKPIRGRTLRRRPLPDDVINIIKDYIRSNSR